MRIDQLETGTVLVSMESEDMRRYQLDLTPQSDLASFKKGLLKVVRQVQDKCGLTGRGESYLVEALPGKNGCLLMITVHTVMPKRRVYRVRRSGNAAWVFDSADAMLDCMHARLMPEKYELYLFYGSYILLTDIGAGSAALSEYAVSVRMSRSTPARIREYGKLVSL